MKKLIIVAIALFTLNIAAAEPVKPSETLRSEIIELIGGNSPFDLKNDQQTINVIFTVNSKNEIIVLSADTNNEELIKFVQKKLNYKKVNYKSTKAGELFLLPVTFKNS